MASKGGKSTTAILHQAGVIAYRVKSGAIQVLLITSRDTGRWIIPKGNISSGSTPAKAAEREAYEEAGIKGTIIGSVPLGFYTYFKQLRPIEQSIATTVEVYLLRTDERSRKWPEKGQRNRSWVSLEDAISRIQEPGVVPLLRRVTECASKLLGDPDLSHPI
jgi:8-oxo-dGTP pyrophosphatase MutT (NUDIX family)